MRARFLNESSGNVADEQFNGKIEIDWGSFLDAYDLTRTAIIDKDGAEVIIRELRRTAVVIENAIKNKRTLWTYAGLEDGLEKAMAKEDRCERCHEGLNEDETFHISTDEPPSKSICGDCHDSYVSLMEGLTKEYGSIGTEQMREVRRRITTWFEEGR
jgi:hypothetical protein